jgi:hypothetical protein
MAYTVDPQDLAQTLDGLDPHYPVEAKVLASKAQEMEAPQPVVNFFEFLGQQRFRNRDQVLRAADAALVSDIGNEELGLNYLFQDY